jgi:hypothetical protein
MKRLAAGGQGATVNPAVVFQQVQDGVAAGQVFIHRVGAPDGPRAALLAQHVEAGGVIDLRIHQHHRFDAATAQPAGRPGAGEGLKLLEDVGEALTRVQRAPSALTAMEDWVRR